MKFPSKGQVNLVMQTYPPGTRVELVSMDDPYTDLKPGSLGTVDFVDDTGTVHVNWDSGSTLGVVYGVDAIKPVSEVDGIVKSQILEVRATGKTNMFDVNAVQRIASLMGFHELARFIETDCDAYVSFILTGKRGSRKKRGEKP